jgi:hypothetical protein
MTRVCLVQNVFAWTPLPGKIFFIEIKVTLGLRIATCRGVHVTIKTGSISDDWTLLALRLQSLLITFNHNAIAVSHILQSLHTNPLCPNLYSTNLHSSLTAPNCTELVPIRFSTANRLLISLYYSSLKSSNHNLNLHRTTSNSSSILQAYCLLATAHSSRLRLLSTTRTLNCYCQLPTRYSGKLVIQPWPDRRKQSLFCCVIRDITWSIHNVVWRHPRMRGHEENVSTILLRGACTRTPPPGCRPAMPWANPSQYLYYCLR